MFLKSVFMAVIGLSFGFLVSAGVFTVLIAVGLVPRFAVRHIPAKKYSYMKKWWWQAHYSVILSVFLSIPAI